MIKIEKLFAQHNTKGTKGALKPGRGALPISQKKKIDYFCCY